jgi:hypothetical protein
MPFLSQMTAWQKLPLLIWILNTYSCLDDLSVKPADGGAADRLLNNGDVKPLSRAQDNGLLAATGALYGLRSSHRFNRFKA